MWYSNEVHELRYCLRKILNKFYYFNFFFFFSKNSSARINFLFIVIRINLSFQSPLKMNHFGGKDRDFLIKIEG